ncbi:beta-ketoacyl synthase N-terminal-like domain-containing protein [Amycolatopsis minnesotensis]|uniref:Type I polyketide synthase n=1 Tax=Amycolatopsis minnesotensis TaxID=337894 RepID=A0ABN2QCD6_9PSEU
MTTARELRSWLIEQVAEVCELDEDEIDPGLPLDEYGLSSRDAVQLSGALEELLDRPMPTTLLWEHPTIDRLAAALTGSALTGSARDDSAPARPASVGEPIAVVGVGCRLPGGVHGADGFWRLLTEARAATSEVPAGRWEHDEAVAEAVGTTRWGGFLDDVAGFDAEFFGITPHEAARMDPQQRMVLEVAWEALEHAGIAPESLRGTETGVFVGISGTEYAARALGDLSEVDAWTGTGGALSIAANRLSYVLDLRGPSVAVDSACSSSLTAVHLAVQSLRSGETGAALVGGANLLLGPGVTTSFDEMGISSADGRCKPFSHDADGIARAEGAGMVVLKRLSDAVEAGDRVLAVVRGTAANSDGRSNGLTAPNPEAQENLLRTACRQAGIAPADVAYVEAHGTGTLLGDPIEARALGAVLGEGRDEPLLLGSVKSNLGHLEAAAGVAGLIKTVLALHHGTIPASLNYAGPNPHIDFDALKLSVVDSARPWPDGTAVAGVSGFGFGGTNAHVVLEQAPGAVPPAPSRETRGRFLLGAPSADRIADSAAELAAWLKGTGTPLTDVEHTLARRLGGRHRAAVVAEGREDLITGLRALAAGANAPGVVTGKPRQASKLPVFVFSGHGSQWAGMGKRLYAEEPVFAAAIDRLDPVLAAESGYSLKADLLGGVDARTMDHVQPLLFGIQLALTELWAANGVRPGAVIGHSFGEVSAAVVAGAISEADGAKIVSLRSRLLASLAGDGAMALLELGAEEAGELVDGLSDVDVAVLSAPKETVIAGSADEVRRIVSDVDSRGLLAKLVKLDVAAHSPIVDRVTGTLVDGLIGIRADEPALDFYSTADADPRGVPAFDPGYWAANLRRPVRFSGAVSAAAEDGYDTFVEISPHPVLRHALTGNLGESGTLVLSSGSNSGDETTHFHTQLAALELAGGVRVARGGAVTDVPSTPWRHVRHWLPQPAPAAASGSTSDTRPHPLLGTGIDLPDEPKLVWQAELDRAALPWLPEYRWDGKPTLAPSAYLELANAAARTAFVVPADRVLVRDLELLAALPLGESTSVTTTVVPETGEFRVHGRADGAPWRLLATAEVSVLAETAITPPVSEVDDRDLRRRGGTDPAPQTPGYGPSFATISAIRVATGRGLRAVAEVEVPAGLGHELRLHPALVDPCLRLFTLALNENDSGASALVPVSLGTVRVYGDPARAASVRIAVTTGADGGHVGDLHLVDPDGVVVLEIGEISLHKATSEELLAPVSERLVEPRWRLDPLPSRKRPRGRVVLLSAGAHELEGPLKDTGADVTSIDYRDKQAIREVIAADGDLSLLFLQPANGTGLDAIAAAERAVLAVSDTIHLLGERTARGHARVCVVTAEAAAVHADEPVDPAVAAQRGLVRMFAYVYPELGTTIIDVAPGIPGDVAAASLLAELATGTDDEVALRRDGRYTRLLQWATPSPKSASVPVVRDDGAYLITGGLGGLGIFLASWLAGKGAARIVLNGRSAPSASAREAIAAMPCDVRVVLGDLAEPEVAERLTAAATEDGLPLRGVLHAAAVFADRNDNSALDADILHRTWLPKVHGGWRLHEATKQDTLDWWVGFSSAATTPGLPGQPAYSTANAYLEALVEHRRAGGLPATSVAWGAWAEVGVVADIDLPWLRPMRPSDGLDVLTTVLSENRPTTGAVRLAHHRLLETFPHLAGIPFFGALFEGVAPVETGDDRPLIERLTGLSTVDAHHAVSDQFRTRVAGVLGYAAESLDVTAPLPALGVDSLLAVRIRNAVQHDFDRAMPVSLLLRGANVLETEQWLLGELGLEDAGDQWRATSVGPRDAAERLVSAVWADVLGEQHGVTADFYAEGGVREQAEAITALLSERSGRELTVSELFEHPTIERMAVHLRDDEAEGCLVRPLRTQGNQRPLFFFHPGGGDTSVYRQLVQLLDQELPVYGFDRVDGVVSVEERVERYLPELRKIQPHGPYRLAGWSFGGFIAFDMAQRLRAEGEEVELLAMMDTILPLTGDTGLSDVDLMRKRLERFGEFLETSYGKRIDLPFDQLARLGVEDQAQLLVDTMRGENLVNGEVSEAILHHQRTSFVDARALEFYRPERYDAPLVFFSAADQVPGGLRDHRFDRTDPARGWDAVCPALDVIVVPGHHLSLLDPPNVDHIAARLTELLSAGAPVGAGSRR